MNIRHAPLYLIALAIAATVLIVMGVPVTTLLLLLIVLACPIMMMLMMGGHGERSHTADTHDHPGDAHPHRPTR
ncbi:DUF2933 domain-containing protein [Nocardia pneumoniae]|uniref:DUF2933 domain-containing protein n=1 Tax=Nocardia pneumoniae TaxID=228601 RepID=UPI0002DACB86|nr:DUF2933 domain-containing protein [Nocardia pneumoniae]